MYYGIRKDQCISSDVSNIGLIDSIRDLSNFNSVMWLAKRPVELIQLLSKICNIDVNTASTSKLIILSKIVELIYYCKNSRKVLSNHFLENLLCYSFTNSKSYLSFLGNRSPGGSYSLCKKVVKGSKQRTSFTIPE